MALPKLFSAPVAAPLILLIDTPPVVKSPVHVGVVLFWSTRVTEAVAGATIVTKVFQVALAAFLIWGIVSTVSLLVHDNGGTKYISVFAVLPLVTAW